MRALALIPTCNAPSWRLWRCYCDVCMQGRNTLIYTLSISTEKNQSTKVRSVYIFQHKEYNYKVITERDIILQVHYIITRHKRNIYNM